MKIFSNFFIPLLIVLSLNLYIGNESNTYADNYLPTTSIGYPDLGWLKNGHPLSLLELKKHYLQFPYTLNENLKKCKKRIEDCPFLSNYVTDELFQIVENSSFELNKLYHGTYLIYGDASHKMGGHNIGHKSHQSGRDIDIHLFSCIVDKNDICVPTPLSFYYNITRMIAFDSKGFSKRVSTSLDREFYTKGFFKFDIERNYSFLKILYKNYGEKIQSIFLAYSLKKLILKYAKSVDSEIEFIKWLDKKIDIISSPPHDNHFHLRIYCSDEDKKEGCYNSIRFK